MEWNEKKNWVENKHAIQIDNWIQAKIVICVNG